MKMKKVIGIVLIGAMVLSSMGACAADSKTLTMGTNAEFPPFEYVTDSGLIGNYSGVDVAIALEIAKSMGKELKIENMEFAAVLSAVPSGKVDMGIAGMTADDERRQSMDFSIPYYVATQYIIVKENDNSIQSAADLIDKKVGVVDGYTGQKVCMDTLKIKNLMGYKKGVDAVMGLQQGKVDAVVIDSHTAIALVAQNSGLVTLQDPNVFESENYAIAVKKGNKELLDKINVVLQDLIDSGKIDEFIATYTAEVGVE